MIHVKCPDCDSTLAVKDIYAGKLARCPICQGKVRIPKQEEEAEDDAPEERVSTRTRSRAPAETKRPSRRVEEEEDAEERPSPPKRKPVARREVRSENIQEKRSARPAPKPPPDDDDDDDDSDEITLEVDEPPPPRKRKKKRRRRRRPPAESSSLSDVDWGKWMLIGLGVLALIGFGSMAAAFAFPPFMLIPIALGFLLVIVGNIWFLIVAFQDEVIHGVLCLVLGIYRLYYLIINFDEEKMPFFVEVLGWLMIIGGLCAGGAIGHHAAK